MGGRRTYEHIHAFRTGMLGKYLPPAAQGLSDEAVGMAGADKALQTQLQLFQDCGYVTSIVRIMSDW